MINAILGGTIVILLLLAIAQNNVKSTENMISENVSYVKLYDSYEALHPFWEFPNTIQYDKPASLTFRNPKASSRVINDSGFVRHAFPINLKSLDINVVKMNDGKDDSRVVHVYSIFPNSAVSSTMAVGDAYTDPQHLFPANSFDPIDLSVIDYAAASPKYQKIVTVKAGERIKMDINVPVKRVMVVCCL